MNTNLIVTILIVFLIVAALGGGRFGWVPAPLGYGGGGVLIIILLILLLLR